MAGSHKCGSFCYKINQGGIFMSLNVERKITKYNRDTCASRKIKYIVVHWVGSESSAKNNADYFYGGDRGASAHYFVDDNTIWQSVSEKDIAWAVGSSGFLDQGSPYAKYGHKYWAKCTNSNSLSIEMCCKKNSKGQLYITDKTIERTAKLVQAIQKRLKINDANVIRHFDVNGKLCPYPYIEESKWKILHARLTGNYVKVKTKGNLIVRSSSLLTSKKIDTLVKGKIYEIVKTNSTGNRGQLKDGGWITITSKYVSKL